MNRRNACLALLALGAAPLTGSAQPAGKVHKIGMLAYTAPRSSFATILTALRALGYEEGKNLAIEYRLADGQLDRLPALAAELVAAKVDLIVAVTNSEILAAMRATTTIPIVMMFSQVPVESGLVASLVRPGGNVTGTTTHGPETAGKILEVLHDTIPRAKRVAVLWESANPGMEPYRQATERAAAAMGIRLTLLPVQNIGEIEASLVAIVKQRPDALMIVPTGAIMIHRARVIEFAARQRLPAIYTFKRPVIEGGLISYSQNFVDLATRSASFVDRILKGAKPGDLAVEQPTTFELVVNMKTADALGLRIPESVLIRADEVIR